MKFWRFREVNVVLREIQSKFFANCRNITDQISIKFIFIPDLYFPLSKYQFRFLISERGYKRYRVPKTRSNYEIRPDPPPFFNKGEKFQESFMKMRRNSEEVQKSLIEGLDFPMLVSEERPRLIACSNAVASAFQGL